MECFTELGVILAQGPCGSLNLSSFSLCAAEMSPRICTLRRLPTWGFLLPFIHSFIHSCMLVLENSNLWNSNRGLGSVGSPAVCCSQVAASSLSRPQPLSSLCVISAPVWVRITVPCLPALWPCSFSTLMIINNQNITQRVTPSEAFIFSKACLLSEAEGMQSSLQLHLPPSRHLCWRSLVFPLGTTHSFCVPGNRCLSRNSRRKCVPCLADASALPH